MTALQLHDYQEVCKAFIQPEGGRGLFLDMGLGKTATCLRALTPEMLPALVCAPKRVAEEVWPEEVPKWRPDLTVAVAKGGPAARQRALDSGADVVVIGRDNLAQAVPVAGKFKTFIIDELSGFKSRASQRWKQARKITRLPNVTRVWGLTGTPSPNGLMDMWAQMYLLDNGASLGKTIGGYRERYFVAGRQLPTGVVTEWNLRPGADKRIHKLMETTAISMATEGRLDLPPVTYNDVQVPMTPAIKQLYKTMKQDMVASTELLGLGPGTMFSAPTAAALSNKLAQITAGFMYHDDSDLTGGTYDVLHREKARAALEIVEGTGSPVVIAYWFKAELAILQETFGSRAHTVDSPGVVQAWNRGDIPVLLLHPASAGHGLNLQYGGHTLIWTTLPWSLELYQQTNKRLPRQGQKHPVVIHRLLTPRTVDGAKADVLAEKKTVQDALLDHLDSPL